MRENSPFFALFFVCVYVCMCYLKQKNASVFFLRCVAFRLPFSLLPREEEDNEKEEKTRQKTQRQATPSVGFSVSSSSSSLFFFLRL